MAPRWYELLRIYRRLEAIGKIRGGHFVNGFSGEQFALPEAVDAMRSIRNMQPETQPMAVSTCDPLNLAGILTSEPKVPALLGNRIVFHNGVPIASRECASLHWHTEVDEKTRDATTQLLITSQTRSHRSNYRS